eukprot:2317863-Ditylum_brightwellii.AAC.1
MMSHNKDEGNKPSMQVLPVEKGLGFYLLNNQPKKAKERAVLDAAVSGSGGAKDCGNLFMVEKGWFVGNQQDYAKRFISLILNLGIKGGSATDIIRRFDYALGLEK